MKNNSPGPGPGQYNVSGLSAKGKYVTQIKHLHVYKNFNSI